MVLKETDPPKRLQFCNLVLSNQLENPRWLDRIFFSDEVSLGLNGTVNTRNCYYYAEENKHRIIQKPLGSVSITVWAMVFSDGRVRHKILDSTMNSE